MCRIRRTSPLYILVQQRGRQPQTEYIPTETESSCMVSQQSEQKPTTSAALKAIAKCRKGSRLHRIPQLVNLGTTVLSGGSKSAGCHALRVHRVSFAEHCTLKQGVGDVIPVRSNSAACFFLRSSSTKIFTFDFLAHAPKFPKPTN